MTHKEYDLALDLLGINYKDFEIEYFDIKSGKNLTQKYHLILEETQISIIRNKDNFTLILPINKFMDHFEVASILTSIFGAMSRYRNNFSKENKTPINLFESPVIFKGLGRNTKYFWQIILDSSYCMEQCWQIIKKLKLEPYIPEDKLWPHHSISFKKNNEDYGIFYYKNYTPYLDKILNIKSFYVCNYKDRFVIPKYKRFSFSDDQEISKEKIESIFNRLENYLINF